MFKHEEKEREERKRGRPTSRSRVECAERNRHKLISVSCRFLKGHFMNVLKEKGNGINPFIITK